MNKDSDANEPDDKNISLKNVISSVGFAFLGVQSEKNRKRDFSQGKFSHFVIAGILGVILFIGILISIVSLILPDLN